MQIHNVLYPFNGNVRRTLAKLILILIAVMLLFNVGGILNPSYTWFGLSWWTTSRFFAILALWIAWWIHNPTKGV